MRPGREHEALVMSIEHRLRRLGHGLDTPIVHRSLLNMSDRSRNAIRR